MPRVSQYTMTSQIGSVSLFLNMGGANNSQGGSGAELQSLTLPITPEDIQINRPSRQAVTQTLTGAYQDHLGSGIATVSMRGHTGWRNLTPEGDGYAVIKKLRDLLGQYDRVVATDRPDKVSLMLLFNLPSGWEQFRVSKTTATYTRSRAQPLLYRYEIQFIVLKDLNDATGQIDPSPNFIIQQGIFPDVQLINVSNTPNTSTTTTTAPGADTDPSTVINDQAQYPPHPTSVYLNGEWLEVYGIARPSDSVPISLQAFTDLQYPQGPAPDGYPPIMYRYVIAANRDFFQFKGVIDPATYMIKPLQELFFVQIAAADAWHTYGAGGQVVATNDRTNYGDWVPPVVQPDTTTYAFNPFIDQ